MKKLTFLIVFTLCGLSLSFAKSSSVKRPDSFNFQKALECLDQNDYEKAYDYMYQEYKDNPKGGYASYWLGYIRGLYSEYGRALNSYSEALQYIPSNDIPYIQAIYHERSQIYLKLNDTIQALNDIKKGLKLDPKNVSLYQLRADIYYYMGNYTASDADYKSMMSVEPGNAVAYLGMGRNLSAKGKHEEAIKKFDYANSLDPENANVYAFRAESYLKLNNYESASNDLINALILAPDYYKALYLLVSLRGDAISIMIPKLKVQMMKNPDSELWPLYIGYLYENNDDYKGAIPFYDKSLSKKLHDKTSLRLSICYENLGDYNNSMKYIDLSIKLDTTNLSYLDRKGLCYMYQNDQKSAMNVFDQTSKSFPDYYGTYRFRGILKYEMGLYKEAVEDLSMAITLQPKKLTLYEHRSRVYLKLGDTKAANADFEKSIELEKAVGDTTYATVYALCFTGKKDEALKVLSHLKSDSKNDVDYNEVCVYSILGEKEKAIETLKNLLENGYRNFYNIDNDTDFDNIKDLPEFKALIKEYKAKLKQELEDLKSIKTISNFDNTSENVNKTVNN